MTTVRTPTKATMGMMMQCPASSKVGMALLPAAGAMVAPCKAEAALLAMAGTTKPLPAPSEAGTAPLAAVEMVQPRSALSEAGTALTPHPAPNEVGTVLLAAVGTPRLAGMPSLWQARVRSPNYYYYFTLHPFISNPH